MTQGELENKRLATPEDLQLYSYVERRAQEVVIDIIEKINSSSPDKGALIFVYGPQNSGKSIVACRLKRGLRKDDVIAVQPLLERSDVPEGKLFSRLGIECKAMSFSTKKEIEDFFHKASIIIIDEVQFIPSELQSYFLREMELFIDRGGWIIAVGLYWNALRGKFVLSALLREMARYKYELKATCQVCGRSNATQNQRLINGKPAQGMDQDLQAPNDKITYEPRCEECLVVKANL